LDDEADGVAAEIDDISAAIIGDDAPDAAPAEPTTADDGLDIPSFLRRQTAA
jgi:hypothetical protein